jgi:hypothetical protein
MICHAEAVPCLVEYLILLELIYAGTSSLLRTGKIS